MIKTYTYKLYNNPKYEKKLIKWESICRYVYNIALETKIEAYKKGVHLSGFDLSKQLTKCKHTEGLEWIKEVGSDTLQSVTGKLQKTYDKFFSDCKDGTRDKLRAKYLKNCQENNRGINWKKYNNICKPKFKSKKDSHSVNFKSGKGSLKQTIKGFKLPRFGEVKVFNNRKINGNIKTAQLKRHIDGIYLTVQFEEFFNKDYTNTENQGICGIDMGISRFLTTSDGEYIDNPKFLEKQLPKLRIEQRKLSRMQMNGKNYNKQKEVVRRLHKKVTDARMDFLHKQSSEIANYFHTVIREDLDIRNMVENKDYSKLISDVSWGKFFELLNYKTNMVKVNPAYTSQTCSSCGKIDKNSRKSQAIFKCTSCNFEMNADENGALNILEKGIKQIEARALASGSKRKAVA